MEPDWSLWVHDLITGDPIESVTLLDTGDGSFSASLAGDGQSTISFSVAAAETPWTPEALDALLDPGHRMLVRWWGTNGGAHPLDVPMTAHKIDEYDYDRDAGVVAVPAVDLLNEAGWRMVDGVRAPRESVLTITNRSASGAVAQTLGRMMQWGPEWVYPIDLPVDGPGEFSGSWVFWKTFRISAILKEIRERMGVEIYLRPYATSSGGVRFQTRVGAPVTIGGANFNLDAADSPFSGIHFRKNTSQMITGLLGVGLGTGEIRELAWAGEPVSPIRDTMKDFDDLSGDALQQATSQHFEAMRKPIVQWDIGAFTVSADYPPETVAPGRVLNIEVYGDPVIPDGVHTLRVIAVSGGNGRQLKPEVQSA